MENYGTLEHAVTTLHFMALILPEVPVNDAYAATITAVNHVLDAASGMIAVRLQLADLDLRLPSSIHCRVRFIGA